MINSNDYNINISVCNNNVIIILMILCSNINNINVYI